VDQRKPPPEVGIYENVPNDEYHSWAAVSSTLLNKLRQGPRHAQWMLNHGFETKDVFEQGTAIHTVILEPQRFENEYFMRSGS